MYYETGDELIGPAGVVATELEMTPSVALRSLHDQLRNFISLRNAGVAVDPMVHFEGPIEPPSLHMNGRPGDGIGPAIMAYADKIALRGQLLYRSDVIDLDSSDGLGRHGQVTREMFAIEHALAMDLARNYPDQPLTSRRTWARFTLAIAAFWFWQPELLGINRPDANPLLGLRPHDELSALIYDFAIGAWPKHLMDAAIHLD